MDQEIEKHESNNDEPKLTPSPAVERFSKIMASIIMVMLAVGIGLAVWYVGGWIWDGIWWIGEWLLGLVGVGGNDPYRSFNDCYDKYPNNKVLYQLCVDSR